VAWVRQLVPFPCTLITFATWHQGLMVAPGNPKQIHSIADLARPEVSIVNRQPGSGSRSLLDRQLQQAGIPAAAVSGYYREVRGHLAIAEAVGAGLVDVGIGIQAVAAAMGLEFILLEQERYDLAIPIHFLNEPGVQMLLDLLRRPSLRRKVETLGGYDVVQMGAPAPAPRDF
jgi:putative molybdopterin biosynthesis protein